MKRVADVSDWRYRIFRGDGVSAPVGWWLGTRTGDNKALYVNSANVGDFDGEASVSIRGTALALTTLFAKGQSQRVGSPVQ
jgi:hypothetical protein